MSTTVEFTLPNDDMRGTFVKRLDGRFFLTFEVVTKDFDMTLEIIEMLRDKLQVKDETRQAT